MKKTFVLIGLALMFSLAAGTAAFAAAKSAPAAAGNIGVVDMEQVVDRHPNAANVRQQMANLARQKENEANAAADKETDSAKKAQVVQAKRRELMEEQGKLMDSILRDCEQAVRLVAKNKNIQMVLLKNFVVLGGTDITQDVIQQLAKK